jgi:hypothetical protein
LLTTTSADGVTTVGTGGLTLFVRFGSGVGELTLATFVITPPAGALTVNVKLLTCPDARLPTAQLATPPFVVPPPLAPTKTAPPGNASVTTTPPAAEGPKFVTVIV